MADDAKYAGIDPDDIIENIDVPSGQRALVGFLGKSKRKGVMRLYISPSFDNYFEIERKDILKTREIDTCASALGGTVVWVKSTAKIAQFRMRTFEVEDEYLDGRRAAKAALAARHCCDDDDVSIFGGVVQAAGTSVFACGSTSWFLAAPDLPDPWTTSQCNSSTFSNQCTWTAECT